METPGARTAVTVNGSGLPSSSFGLRMGDCAAPSMSHVDVHFQLAKSALAQLQETFPKGTGPVPSRSLSYVRPQTDGLTVKESKGQRRPEDAGKQLGIPLPSGVKPFNCVFKKRQNR